MRTRDRTRARSSSRRTGWFRKSFVGAHLQAADLVAHRGKGGEHDDGHELCARVGFEASADLVAVEARHHDVEHDAVGEGLGHVRERFLAIAGQGHRIPGRAQDGFEQLEVLGLIVHGQDGSTRRQDRRSAFHARSFPRAAR
jgi:hypothetical protein